MSNKDALKQFSIKRFNSNDPKSNKSADLNKWQNINKNIIKKLFVLRMYQEVSTHEKSSKPLSINVELSF